MDLHGQYRDLITAHFPALAAERLEELPHTGWGGDSDAFLVDGTFVFRFPRHDDIRAALATEVRLLPELAPRVGLAIPSFRYVAYERDAPGPPLFAGYPVIEGRQLTPARFREAATDPAAFDRMAAQLGAFLTGVHTFPTDRTVACGVARPERSIREQIEHGYAAIRARVHPALDREERAYLDRLYGAYLGDDRHFLQPPALCHADLTGDHILLAPPTGDGPRGLAGIIDFGDVDIGDPAGDFVWRYEYGEPFFRRVLDRYAAPLADPEAFARVVGFRYRLMAAGEVAYGLETGTAAYVEEGRALLRRDMRAGA